MIFSVKIKKILALVGVFFILTNNTWAFGDSYTALTGDFLGSSLFGAAKNATSVSSQTNAAASTLEQRYGFDSNIIRRFDQSQGGPKVSVSFDNPAPKEGDTVTAIALAEKYQNDAKKLYFTWFLIRAEDSLTDEDTMEIAKRRAAKIVAQGKFDPAYFATDYGTNNSVDADKDYFKAPFGGGDGVGGREGTGYSGIGSYEEDSYLDVAKRVVDSSKITRCYRHNYGYSFDEEEQGSEGSSGKDLVIECEHAFPQTDENGPETVANYCDSGGSDEYVLGEGNSSNGFTADKEACWGLDPNNPDTDGDGTFDEADLIGLGQDQFKWSYKEGDRVGVVVEGMTTVVINEEGDAASYTKMTTADREATCDTEKTTCDDDCSDDYDTDVAAADPLASQNYQTCKDACLQDQTDCKSAATAYVEMYNSQKRIEAEKDAIYGYRKIMWTGIDICTEDKIDLMVEDDCDDTSDVGFSFLASKLVKEKANENIETNINIFPQTPQVSTVDENSSDYVTLKAEVSNETTDDTFAYYKWEIYACGSEGLESCLNSANLITASCVENSSLGECAKKDLNGDGVTDELVLNSSSLAEGMGAREIVFQPKIELLPLEKSYLKVLLKTRRDKNNAQYSVTEIELPFTKSNTGIRFFKVSEISPGVFGFDEAKDEICNKKEGVINDGYSTLCPVFPYQIVAAKSAVKAGANEANFSYNWKIDSQPFSPLSNCPFQNGCTSGLVYFVTEGEALDRKVVTLNVKEDSLNNSTTEKMYSVNDPLGLIKLDTEDVNVAWATLRSNGEATDGIFEAVAGKEASFRLDLIPSYLNQDGKKDVIITWTLNGEELNESYFKKNPDSGVMLDEDGKKIYFPVSQEVGDKVFLKVSVRKSFFAEEEDTIEEQERKEREQSLLENTFGILNYRETESADSVEIRVVEQPVTAMEKGSLKLFFASTIKNAPEYLIFSMRLAIMLVLGWSFLFGFSYLTGAQKENIFSKRNL